MESSAPRTVFTWLLSLCYISLFSIHTSGCQFTMPGQTPPAAEEEPPLEEEATEEAEGEEAPSEPKAPAPETHQRYTRLEDYHPRLLSWATSTGLELKGNLYTPSLEAEALKASLLPLSESDDLSEKDTSEEDIGETEDDTGENPPQPKKVELPKYRYPLIIILHKLSGTQNRASTLIPSLVQMGYAVLALDLPGHGQSTTLSSGRGVQSWREFEAQDWQAIVGDLKQVEQFFEAPNLQDSNAVLDVLPGKLGIIAEGIGANAALSRSGDKDADISFIISIGASIESKGISPALALLESKSPTLFMASKTEPLSYNDTQKLHRLTEPEKALRLYGNIGQGFEMYDATPEVQESVKKWATLHLPPKPIVPEWNTALIQAQFRWNIAEQKRANTPAAVQNTPGAKHTSSVKKQVAQH